MTASNADAHKTPQIQGWLPNRKQYPMADMLPLRHPYDRGDGARSIQPNKATEHHKGFEWEKLEASYFANPRQKAIIGSAGA